MSEESTQLPASQPTHSLPSVWKQNSQGLENLRKARQTIGMKHGMFASVPIICKGRACPYFQTCWIPEGDLQVGERCPIEIAAIVERFDTYCEKLGVPEDDIVDSGLVKEVVDIEIMMLRADSLLATNGNFIEEVVAGITPKGQEILRPELHQAVEFKEKLRREKTRILNQLNATRKDKKTDLLAGNDPSSVAAKIMAKVKRMQEQGAIIDVSPQDVSVENHDADNTHTE